ncbi:hypothetical protein M404DRAFT_1002399 [Pisolithus tinctorius Marx 270]|uniref:Uncharacterized protein n=1 Tax=Pisolithus tinctorius Marx 270 TaxID=870435 RepID=A0A0C3IZZ7_PISTI|nr:hypothetical protein M404DRAFT_1002399 [Pisolithus tinctorius Marx 270]
MCPRAIANWKPGERYLRLSTALSLKGTPHSSGIRWTHALQGSSQYCCRTEEAPRAFHHSSSDVSW